MLAETRLDPEPPGALAALDAALGAGSGERTAALKAVAGANPVFLDAWARLAQDAYRSGDPVAAYAFARVGYHRGLDRIRGAGWRGAGAVPWRYEENRGFLRALHALMMAAAAIGEGVEARRCREFLLQLDPDDAIGVAPIRPADLSRRLPDTTEVP